MYSLEDVNKCRDIITDMDYIDCELAANGDAKTIGTALELLRIGYNG